MKDVIALVLAGGKMGDYGVLTQNRAKGALTVAGIYRIIDFALSNLINSGINRIGLIIQYLPGSLIEHVGSGHPWDLDNYGKMLKIMPPFVGMAEIVWFKGTADAIHQNLNFVRDQKAEHVVVLSGEHVFHIDFKDVLEHHQAKGADITVVTKQIAADQHRKRFGYVQVDDEGRVVQYHEKPATPPSDLAATGIYIFKASTLIELVSKDTSQSEHNLAKDILERYASECKTYEYRMEECWEYLETVRDYYNAHYRLMRDGHFDTIRRWEILTNLKFRNVGHAPAAIFGKNSSVEASMISPSCNIQGTVYNSILSPGVKVQAGAVVMNSILLHDCTVGENAILEHVISDRDAIFGANSIVGKMETADYSPEEDDYPLTLVGKAAKVGEGIVVPPGSQIRPGKMVSTQQALNLELA
jgi:glucose-1-phosphate adenylyltransferase